MPSTAARKLNCIAVPQLSKNQSKSSKKQESFDIKEHVAYGESLCYYTILRDTLHEQWGEAETARALRRVIKAAAQLKPTR